MAPDPIISLVYFVVIVLAIILIWRLQKSTRFLQTSQQIRKTLVEDILKQLYHVEYSGRSASLNAMAGALKLSIKKLLRLIEFMTDRNLMRFDQNTLQLTDSGRDYALKIIRVHRLYEKYLSEKTGFDKSEWHDRAELKEHTLTADQTDELYQVLGNPRFDPHGDPIPTASGEILQPKWQPLSSLKENITARIVHIEDEPDVIYRQIIDKKLHIGSQVKMVAADENHIRFYSEGNEYEFSPIVASNVSVEELTEKESFEENMVRLSALAPGERARVLGISSECRGMNRRRLLDLGFTNGSEIEAEFDSPMKEPKAYTIRNTLIALRGDQADLILIKKVL